MKTPSSHRLFSYGMYAGLVCVSAAALVGIFQTEIANSFEDNDQAPTQGNAPLPLNVSDNDQRKEGNLLIGSGSSAPQNALDVDGDLHVQGNNDSGKANEEALLDLAVDDNDSGINVPTDGVLAFKADNDEKMRIRSSGNVGIGTPNPGSLLTVAGEIKADGLALLGGNSGGAGTSVVSIRNDRVTSSSPFGPSDILLTQEAIENYVSSVEGTPGGPNRAIQYKDGNSFAGSSSFVWDDANEQLGIGTSSPGNTLDVNGAANISDGLFVTSNIDSGGSINAVDSVTAYVEMSAPKYFVEDEGKYVTELINDLINEPGGNDGAIQFNDGGSFEGSSDLKWDDGNKRLGIGTNSPDIQLALGDSDTGLEQQGDGELGIFTNNEERIRVKPGGRVGIGTSDPGSKLTVVGEMKATQILLDSGTAVSNIRTDISSDGSDNDLATANAIRSYVNDSGSTNISNKEWYTIQVSGAETKTRTYDHDLCFSGGQENRDYSGDSHLWDGEKHCRIRPSSGSWSAEAFHTDIEDGETVFRCNFICVDFE